MATIAITGANRGIGLALVKQYHQKGDHVIAICRQTSEALNQIEGIEVLSDIDVTKADDLKALSEQLNDARIDVLVNNAGLLISTSLDRIESDLHVYRAQFEINALAPLRVTQALKGCLAPGSKVIIVTSRMGSMGDNTSGGQFAYRMSKSAVNSAGVSLAHELKPMGVAVALLHPGYVRTDMTGQTGHVDPDQAAANLVERIDALDLSSTGCFLHASGETLPW